MNKLIKIKEVTSKYDITARTLRYYEDMGLISSFRDNENDYRMYDEKAISRIEQILILRKLNISIKDIGRIFAAPDSSAVLEVLDKKVQNIDDEIALLHELKDVVLDFIREIEQINFADNSDIKQLYNKAKDIETQLVSVDYIGKPSGSTVERIIEVTEKLDNKVPDVMVVRVPKIRVASTGVMSWYELMENGGSKQLWDNKHLYKEFVFGCADFLIRTESGFEWIQALKDDVDVTQMDLAPLEIYDFEGGLYAMAVSINGDMDSIDKVEEKVCRWIETTNFEYDGNRGVMGHMAYNDNEITKGLGYAQLQRFVPIKLKEDV